jgi:hypothetical protein
MSKPAIEAGDIGILNLAMDKNDSLLISNTTEITIKTL